jgi:tRNA-dihydrouridine synthase B
MQPPLYSASPTDSKPGTASLPWQPGTIPLMLAPMQGLTNRALRALFIDWVRPDVVFTEFMRVNAAAPVKRLSAVDLKEAAAAEKGVPLVVQLIGHSPEPLVAAARTAQAAGAVHINLNMGCPYGRTTSGFTGGAMLRRPEELEATITALRRAVTGTFSVKLRAGYDDPDQIFSLLPLFEAAGADFLVLHPRTVVQEYSGRADHAVTARVVRRTRLPVIANGDIRDAAAGLRVLEETGAAGLMLGRGAIADPLLFQRLRGTAPAEPARGERGAMLRSYLTEATGRYRELFCGDTQVLGKLKAILAPMAYPDFEKTFRDLRRATTLRAFIRLIDDLE